MRGTIVSNDRDEQWCRDSIEAERINFLARTGEVLIEQTTTGIPQCMVSTADMLNVNSIVVKAACTQSLDTLLAWSRRAKWELRDPIGRKSAGEMADAISSGSDVRRVAILSGGDDMATAGARGSASMVVATRAGLRLLESRTDKAPGGDGSTVLICGVGYTYSLNRGWSKTPRFDPRSTVNALASCRAEALQNEFVGDWRAMLTDGAAGEWLNAELSAMTRGRRVVVAEQIRSGVHTDAQVQQILNTGTRNGMLPSPAYVMLHRAVASSALVRASSHLDQAVAAILANAGPAVEVLTPQYRQARDKVRGLLRNYGRLAEIVFLPDKIPSPTEQARLVDRICDDVQREPNLLIRCFPVVGAAVVGASSAEEIVDRLDRPVIAQTPAVLPVRGQRVMWGGNQPAPVTQAAVDQILASDPLSQDRVAQIQGARGSTSSYQGHGVSEREALRRAVRDSLA